ncbi:MAG: lactam utilization protein LamB, partial [Rhizobacter sp.]|nr:lactam utilization protein LamB [Rhizobacter sp.]
NAPADELVNDMIYQLGALREFTRLCGVPLQHLKPHGALYMHAAKDEPLSRALVTAMQKTDPSLYLYCMEGSVTCKVAREMGQPVVREFYADRDYDASGSIVFVRRVQALDPQAVAAKVVRACVEGRTATVEGGDVEIGFDSVCIHSDTPGALALVTATRAALAAAGIQVAGLAQALLAKDA